METSGQRVEVDSFEFAVCALIERLDLVFRHTTPGWNVRKGFSYTLQPQRPDMPSERTVAITPNGWGEKAHILCSFVREHTGEWRPNAGSVHTWHLKQPFDFAFQEITFGHTFELRATSQAPESYLRGLSKHVLQTQALILRHEARA